MTDEDGIQAPPMVNHDLVETVAPGVHVIPDDRVDFVPNVGIVEGDRAVLVIDTAMGHANGESLLQHAKQIAGSRKLLLTTTHFHPEHAFGAKPFEPEATYVMNASQADELVEKGAEYVELFSGFGPGLATLLADVDLIPPDLTYSGRLAIDLGGRTVDLIDVGPIHTKGDQLVFLPEERVLFTGDLVENGFFAIFPDPDANGFSWLEAIEEMAALEPVIVVGGHGAVGGPELIDALRQYLEMVRDRTAELIAADIGLEAMVATIEPEVIARFDGWSNEIWIAPAIESFKGGVR